MFLWIFLGEDGPSQMGLEDIAMFRTLPGATVFYPRYILFYQFLPIKIHSLIIETVIKEFQGYILLENVWSVLRLQSLPVPNLRKYYNYYLLMGDFHEKICHQSDW